jgi:hypothetical protein
MSLQIRQEQRFALPALGRGTAKPSNQKKPEAREMLKNAAESPASSNALLGYVLLRQTLWL